MFTEAFYVEPDLCCCIVHDFQNILDDLGHQEYQKLREEANRDTLTGLYNRHYLSELDGRVPQEETMGVAYLDVNDLKSVNDAFGHAAGDARILELVKVIRTYYGDCMAFRMGGDEFAVIAFGLDQMSFERRSRACRTALEESGLAAIGYRYFEKPESLEQCIDQCDAAMYREKKRMKRSCQ
jgi:diguanylate cyclase (GGDEF)-like protein